MTSHTAAVKLIFGILALSFIAVYAVGCGSTGSSDLPTTPADDPARDTTGADDVPADLANVVWLHTDVSAWPVTADLRSVTIAGGTITLDYDKATVWPAKRPVSSEVNANPWVFVKFDGLWHAGTFEWFRRGQTSKPVAVVNGDHIKQNPLQRFSPRSGERYGFMVSGLARSGVRNVMERSQVVMVTWP
jgi:hypothetical protein